MNVSIAEGKVVYDFNENSTFQKWMVVDDGVMGGFSSGNLRLDENGNGIF